MTQNPKDERDDLYHSSLLSGHPNDNNFDLNNTIDVHDDRADSRLLRKSKFKKRELPKLKNNPALKSISEKYGKEMAKVSVRDSKDFGKISTRDKNLPSIRNTKMFSKDGDGVQTDRNFMINTRR